MDLKELESGVDPGSHWYYQSKKGPLVRFVREVYRKHNRKVVLVDVGSGSGFFMYELFRLMPEVIEKIWLVDIHYTETETRETAGKTVEKSMSLPPVIEHAVVVMMDVLEHVSDDVAMLSEITRRCKGVNYYFITVPAFMSLWSGHDVYLGHYRRYTSKTLAALLKSAGLSDPRIYYMFFAIFPLVWSVRTLKSRDNEPQSSMKPSHPIVNSILRSYNAFEMHFSRLNRLFGVTCAAEGEF